MTTPSRISSDTTARIPRIPVRETTRTIVSFSTPSRSASTRRRPLGFRSASPATRSRSGAPGRPLAEGAFRRYPQGSGIVSAEWIMRRTLVILLGIWAVAAPTACLALCSEPLAAIEIGSVAAEQHEAPCHQTASSERNAQDPEPAPEPSGGCCLEQQPGLTQASAPESLRAPLVFTFRATSEIAVAIAPTTVSPLLLRASRIHTPHLQSNPPLLI